MGVFSSRLVLSLQIVYITMVAESCCNRHVDKGTVKSVVQCIYAVCSINVDPIHNFIVQSFLLDIPRLFCVPRQEAASALDAQRAWASIYLPLAALLDRDEPTDQLAAHHKR